MKKTLMSQIEEINQYIYQQILDGNFELVYKEQSRNGFEYKIKIEGLIFSMNIFNNGNVFLHDNSNFMFNMNNLPERISFDRKSISEVLKIHNKKVIIEDLEFEKFKLNKEIKRIEGQIRSIESQIKNLRINE